MVSSVFHPPSPLPPLNVTLLALHFATACVFQMPGRQPAIKFLGSAWQNPKPWVMSNYSGPVTGAAFITALKPCGLLLRHVHRRATETYIIIAGRRSYPHMHSTVCNVK